MVNQKEGKVTATTTDTNIMNPDRTQQKPRKFLPDTSYSGINSIQIPFSKCDPQPGDLVISTAGEIFYPIVHNRSVDSSHVLLGVVTVYTYMKWVSVEGQDQFDNYANNHERVVVRCAKTPKTQSRLVTVQGDSK